MDTRSGHAVQKLGNVRPALCIKLNANAFRMMAQDEAQKAADFFVGVIHLTDILHRCVRPARVTIDIGG